MPHEMAEHARAEIVVGAVGQHDQPLAASRPSSASRTASADTHGTTRTGTSRG